MTVADRPFVAHRHGDQLFVILAKSAASNDDSDDVVMASPSDPSPRAPGPVTLPNVAEEKLDKDLEKKDGLIGRKFDSRLWVPAKASQSAPRQTP